MVRLRFSTVPVMFVSRYGHIRTSKLGGRLIRASMKFYPFSRLKLGGWIMCGWDYSRVYTVRKNEILAREHIDNDEDERRSARVSTYRGM